MAKQVQQLKQLDGEPYTYEALAIAGNETLEDIFRRGVAPDLETLSGWEFKGYNTLDVTQVLGFRKFKKGFYRANGSGDFSRIDGYNVKIKQAQVGLEEAWIDVVKGGESVKHGWFDVYPVNLNEVDNKYPRAVLLNYGTADRNPKVDPSRALRDYLVQVYPDNPDLLLGKAYVALGVLRVPVSFFILERSNRSALTA